MSNFTGLNTQTIFTLSDATTKLNIHIVTTSVYFLIELAVNGKDKNVLFEYLRFPRENFKAHFIVAGQSNEQAMVMNALGRSGTHTRYKCSCGCIY